jgi:hypothetical protein
MVRDKIIDIVRLDLIGPSENLDDKDLCSGSIDENPMIKYLSGILEPNKPNLMEDINLFDESEKSFEDAITSTSQSGMGISFVVTPKAHLSIKVHFGIYSREENLYKRKSISKSFLFLTSDIQLGFSSLKLFEDENKTLEMVFVNRSNEGGGLMIISIVNTTKLQENRRPKYNESFFQLALEIESSIGFLPLKNSDSDLSRDDKLNKLLYSDYLRYANGHGCSVDTIVENNVCKVVRSTFLPDFVIDKLVHSEISVDSEIVSYSMAEMMDGKHIAKWLPKLHLIPKEYKKWCLKQDVSECYDLSDVVNANGKSIDLVIQRIERGIELIEKDEKIRLAFVLMNEAMLLQQLRSKQSVQDFNLTVTYNAINPFDKNTWPKVEKFEFGQWRLFQIAFILMNIGAIAGNEEQDRIAGDFFDLIWFPTGGGKTEAYLGLSAFTLFWELIEDEEVIGVSIIMRYTLRLLSSQQFERASALIVACNDVKAKYSILGSDISIGLWVGQATTPNTRAKAMEAFEEMKMGGENKFSVSKCPRCMAEFGKCNENGILNGFKEGDYGIEFHCYVCNLDNAKLPIYVVDEDIKREKPKLLIGTVDKFALLAWDPNNRYLLGVDVPSAGLNKPIKLIIQDELHLIDGPLGTIVGLYEIALDYIFHAQKIRPKRIGSTATISRAFEQLLNLYGKKETEIQFFPQPYITVRDNFFSKSILSPTARKYVGLYANSSPSLKTTQYRLTASLLQASKLSIKGISDSLEESYQTIISYFNTLKDLGHTRSMLADDIPQHMKVIHRSWNLDKEDRRYVDDFGIVELTSRVKSSDLVENMDRLFKSSVDKGKVDICLATNMISVGLDVPRLATMIINKQPKSTAEYIQASSRVGRGAIPGLVWMLYAPNRSRDRSYFEQFKYYHSTLQKNVEPASVTPFAKPARERALPGVLISILRNCPNSSHKDSPINKIEEAQWRSISEFIKKRCQLIDLQEIGDLELQLSDFLQRWNQGYNRYSSFGEDAALAGLKAFITFEQEGNSPTQKPRPFPILTSMRSVDIEENIDYLQ